MRAFWAAVSFVNGGSGGRDMMTSTLVRSMIRKSMPSGYDPMGGHLFSLATNATRLRGDHAPIIARFYRHRSRSRVAAAYRTIAKSDQPSARSAFNRVRSDF